MLNRTTARREFFKRVGLGLGAPGTALSFASGRGRRSAYDGQR